MKLLFYGNNREYILFSLFRLNNILLFIRRPVIYHQLKHFTVILMKTIENCFICAYKINMNITLLYLKHLKIVKLFICNCKSENIIKNM